MDKHLAIYLFLLTASIAPQPCIAQQHIDTAKVYQLNEVTVKSAYKTRAGNLYQYDRNQFGSIVTLIGETDVLRYIATLPGVAQGMEGGMSYYIRGGGNGNNRFELDGIPVYGNTHLFGIFSVFHPDIISEVNFYSGGIPSSTGNLLASVTEKFMSSTQSASRYRESPTSNTLSAFAEGTYTQTYTGITLGVRGNLYASQGYNAFIPDVHLSIKQYLTSDLRFIASVDRMSQYNHIVEGLPIGWSLDLSVPANAAFKPETAWQGYAGLIFNSKGWTLSAGGYYKRMENLTSYSNPANVFYKDMNWHEEVIVGVP